MWIFFAPDIKILFNFEIVVKSKVPMKMMK